VISSPVETPALAAAVRKDWARLSSEQHKQSLIEDAMNKSPFEAYAALKRLLYYYPEDGEQLAQRLLDRPWYDGHKLWNFIVTKLVKEQNPEKWRGLIDRFREENGTPASDAIPFRLHWIYWRVRKDEKLVGEKAIAAKILQELYPKYDPDQPPFINATETEEQTALVQALSAFRSEKFDSAVLKLLRSIDLEKYEVKRRIDADHLALTCMGRLLGKGFDKEFATYCERRIKDLQGKKREPVQDQRLESLSGMLATIRSAEKAL
jgi:hypothetical protein